MTIGRSIRLFLADGTPGGVITAEIMNWTGHVLVAPRSRLVDLIQRSEAGRTGVYFLIGPDPEGTSNPLVYIGETDNVGKRLAQHNKDEAKDFWDRACLVTSKDQNLTKAHVRYLESRLITIAAEAGRSRPMNSTAPDFGLLPEADIADMEFFIEQIRIVLPVLGMDFLRASGATLLRRELTRSSDASLENMPVIDPAAASPIAADPAIGSRTLSTRYRPSTDGQLSPDFELADKRTGFRALAREIDGEMIVLQGSQAKRLEGDSLTPVLRQKRRSLAKAGVLVEDPDNPKLFKLLADTPCGAPSQASSLLLGRSDNGRKSWRIKDSDVTYGEWQEQQVAAVAGEDADE